MKTQKKDPTIEESNQDLITEGFKKGPFTDNSKENHIAEKIRGHFHWGKLYHYGFSMTDNRLSRAFAPQTTFFGFSVGYMIDWVMGIILI